MASGSDVRISLLADLTNFILSSCAGSRSEGLQLRLKLVIPCVVRPQLVIDYCSEYSDPWSRVSPSKMIHILPKTLGFDGIYTVSYYGIYSRRSRRLEA